MHFLVSPTRGHHVLKAAVSKGVSLLSYTRAFQIAAVSEADLALMWPRLGGTGEGLFLDMC